MITLRQAMSQRRNADFWMNVQRVDIEALRDEAKRSVAVRHHCLLACMGALCAAIPVGLAYFYFGVPFAIPPGADFTELDIRIDLSVLTTIATWLVLLLPVGTLLTNLTGTREAISALGWLAPLGKREMLRAATRARRSEDGATYLAKIVALKRPILAIDGRFIFEKSKAPVGPAVWPADA